MLRGVRKYHVKKHAEGVGQHGVLSGDNSRRFSFLSFVGPLVTAVENVRLFVC